MNSEKIQLLATVLNDLIKESNAIICLQGDGYARADMSADLFKKGLSSTVVVSGGIYNDPTVERLVDYLKEKGIGNIILENQSQNTKDQAINVIELAKKNNWKKIILVASGFHQLRAFLTFLKAAEGIDLKIFNAPAENLSWFENTQWNKTRLELLEQEFKKIDEYMLKGHLATFNQGLEHQKQKI